MTKTIEELAKQYAEDMCPVGDYCGGVYDEQRNSDLPIYTNDAKSVLKWLFDRPLTERLNEEEKALIRSKYCQCKRYVPQNSNNRLSAYDVCMTLESIFGKEFFKEEE